MEEKWLLLVSLPQKTLMGACIQMFMNWFESNLGWLKILFSTFWYWCNWPLPWFKVTGVQESKIFCTNYLTKLSIDLNGIWHTFNTCWYHEPHTHFMSSSQYSRERTLLTWFHKKRCSIALYSDIYKPISFKLGMTVETTKRYILILVC